MADGHRFLFIAIRLLAAHWIPEAAKAGEMKYHSFQVEQVQRHVRRSWQRYRANQHDGYSPRLDLVTVQRAANFIYDIFIILLDVLELFIQRFLACLLLLYLLVLTVAHLERDKLPPELFQQYLPIEDFQLEFPVLHRTGGVLRRVQLLWWSLGGVAGVIKLV